MMIPHKSNKDGSRRQTTKSKPCNKMHVRCGISEMLHDFIPYGGKGTFWKHTFSEIQDEYGLLDANVVIALFKTIQNMPLSVF